MLENNGFMEQKGMDDIEKNINLQEKYYKILDKLIDAFVALRYERNRDYLTFFSNNQIHSEILSAFSKIGNLPRDYVLEQLAKQIATSINCDDKREWYLQQLTCFYHLYQESHYLEQAITTPFYNEILNRQRSIFFQKEKHQMLSDLKEKLALSQKKEQQVIKGLQLKSMRELFKKQDYEKMGFSKEEIEVKLKEVHSDLKEMKYFKKRRVPTDKEFISLDTLFLSGQLDKEALQVYTNYDLKTIKIIVNHYYRAILPDLNKITISPDKITRENISYHYNHLLIVNSKQYRENKEKIEALIDEGTLDKELLDSEENKEILKLLPFVNILEEFDTNTFLSILKNSKVVMAKIRDNDIYFDGSMNKILQHFDQILSLSLVYDKVDELTTASLGFDIIQKILSGNGNPLVSKDVLDYIDIYKQMLLKREGKIPPICGQYQDYTYESGLSADSMHLLIGLNSINSCLGPKAPGRNAFYKCLVEADADVLIIKSGDGELVARSLMFRKGNFVIMTPFQGQKGIQRQFYRPEFLSKISSELLEKSTMAGDCLDYVLLTNDLDFSMSLYPLLENDAFVLGFPYCDLYEEAYLIGSRKDTFRLQENEETKTYLQTREKVFYKKEGFEDDIRRIDAMKIFMADDSSIKEMFFSNFDDYCEAYVGQDWYLAVTKDQTVKLETLPVLDKRQQLEIEMLKENLKVIYDNTTKMTNFVKVKK